MVALPYRPSLDCAVPTEDEPSPTPGLVTLHNEGEPVTAQHFGSREKC